MDATNAYDDLAAWCATASAEVAQDRSFKTPGQKSLAFVEKLIAFDPVFGKTSRGLKGSTLVAAAAGLGVPVEEVGRCLTLVRACGNGKRSPEWLHRVRSGREKSATAVLRKSGTPPETVESLAKRTKRIAAQVLEDDTLLSTGAKALALVERLIDAKVLSTSKTAVKGLGRISKATGLPPHEFQCAWRCLRVVVRSRLPDSILREVRVGRISCAKLIESHGGLAGLRKLARRMARDAGRDESRDGRGETRTQGEHDAPPESAVIDVSSELGFDQRQTANVTSVRDAASGAEADVVRALSELVTAACAGLELVAEAASRQGDAEFANFVKETRESFGVLKSKASGFLIRKSESEASFRRRRSKC